MGQGTSRPERPAHQTSSPPPPSDGREERQRRRHSSIGNLIRNLDAYRDDATHADSGPLMPTNHSTPRSRPSRSNSSNRLSRLLHPSSDEADADAGPSPSRTSALQRSRSTLAHFFRRDPTARSAHANARPPGILQQRASYVRASGGEGDDAQDFYPPRLPSIDQSSTFDRDMFTVPDNMIDTPPRSSQSHRRSNIRFNALRPDRPFRHLTSSLRRRRSPQPASVRRPPGGTEDQAVLLSQLLSAAAAATAATLMGDDHQALSEARSLSVGSGIGDLGGSGEDGSFEGFLRALQNGRIASALRQSNDGAEGAESASTGGPLNFFRMFRFGSSAPGASAGASSGISGGSDTHAARGNAPQSENATEGGHIGPDGRMVPIIIVGIRSISPHPSTSTGPTDDLPPFLDALTNFASPARESEDVGPLGHSSIDSILRPPQNGTSFRHRRRASMGGFGMSRSRINDRYDDQRDQRSPDRRRERPWSMASSSSTEPRPPPATPASPSPELSRISSRNSTPSHSRPASFVANSMRDFAGESRRSSMLNRSLTSPLSSHTEETVSLHSARSSDHLLQQPHEVETPWINGHRRPETSPHVHYPRFASGHPRRNGVVEPDHLPPLSRSPTASATDGPTSGNRERRSSSNDSRSWIIYVLGGSYPENHPILTTPSLFSDNPTYEDMMLLSALLGPAKAPVATDEDVQSAGGIYQIVAEGDPVQCTQEPCSHNQHKRLVAKAMAESESQDDHADIALDIDLRCLVCLCEFEEADVARRLGKCGHFFHKECIDHWLTQGRNSCPLCRGQGVEEKPAPDSMPTAEATAA